MGFEPEVEKSVKRYHRRIIQEKLLALGPFAAGIVACLILTVVAVFGMGVSATGGLDYMLMAFIFGGAVLAGILYIRASEERTEFQSRFCSEELTGCDRDRVEDFETALEDTSVDLDISTPRLAVMPAYALASLTRSGLAGVGYRTGNIDTDPVLRIVPSSGTRSFLISMEGPVVGISEDLLGLPLSQREIETLMTKELSSIMVGDVSGPPGVTDSKGSLLALLGLFFLLAVSNCVVIYQGTGNPWALIGLAIFVFPVFIPCLLWFLTVYLPDRFLRARHVAEILSDSATVGVTRDTDSLRQAIKKIGKLDLAHARMPDVREPLFRRLWNRMWLRELGDAHQALIEDRLKNLNQMEQGRFRAFEEVDRFEKLALKTGGLVARIKGGLRKR